MGKQKTAALQIRGFETENIEDPGDKQGDEGQGEVQRHEDTNIQEVLVSID